MSKKLTDKEVVLLRQNDLGLLAPGFAIAVQELIRRMNAAGFDAVVFETLRVPKLQDHYKAMGTSQVDWFKSWHSYGLAVDIISKSKQWNASKEFWTTLGKLAVELGLTWGGDWDNDPRTKGFVDLPHVQWGKCRITPSARSKELYLSGGLAMVWDEVDALYASSHE